MPVFACPCNRITKVNIIIRRPAQPGAKEFDMIVVVPTNVTTGSLMLQLEAKYGFPCSRQILNHSIGDSALLDPHQALNCEEGEVLYLCLSSHQIEENDSMDGTIVSTRSASPDQTVSSQKVCFLLPATPERKQVAICLCNSCLDIRADVLLDKVVAKMKVAGLGQFCVEYRGEVLPAWCSLEAARLRPKIIVLLRPAGPGADYVPAPGGLVRE
ncbi:unnamed protein product [Polarella glacialis]|uniref:Ubiquitin-like domain-containing protein n=1 Tax=Polarella glacialis TaxID=89957 RepID=A0A813JVR2_POLGL|nr:unnamed protein product [Polarella glacialis]